MLLSAAKSRKFGAPKRKDNEQRGEDWRYEERRMHHGDNAKEEETALSPLHKRLIWMSSQPEGWDSTESTLGISSSSFDSFEEPLVSTQQDLSSPSCDSRPLVEWKQEPFLSSYLRFVGGDPAESRSSGSQIEGAKLPLPSGLHIASDSESCSSGDENYYSCLSEDEGSILIEDQDKRYDGMVRNTAEKDFRPVWVRRAAHSRAAQSRAAQSRAQLETHPALRLVSAEQGRSEAEPKPIRPQCDRSWSSYGRAGTKVVLSSADNWILAQALTSGDDIYDKFGYDACLFCEEQGSLE